MLRTENQNLELSRSKIGWLEAWGGDWAEQLSLCFYIDLQNVCMRDRVLRTPCRFAYCVGIVVGKVT